MFVLVICIEILNYYSNLKKNTLPKSLQNIVLRPHRSIQDTLYFFILRFVRSFVFLFSSLESCEQKG